MSAGNCEFSSCSSTCICLGYRQRNPDWNGLGGTQCHESKTQSGQRRRSFRKQNSWSRPLSLQWRSINGFMFAAILSIFFCSGRASAENARYVHGRLQQDGLLFDRREPPTPPMQLKIDQGTVLKHRDNSAQPTPLESSRDETTQQFQIPLPSPFDANLGNNFTSSTCPTFFQNFLKNETFRSCLPFSLLLQTSSGFFAISRSFVQLTETLDTACNVDYQQCSTVMSTLAQQIQLTENCGADLQMQNPMVEQAYNGFMAYQPLYRAGCLRDTSGNFCYANAVTNISSPTSSYIYYLPLGVQLPGGTRPACNTCLRSTMTVFAAYASDSNQPLSNDFTVAAQQVDMSCGPRFVEASVQMTSAAQTFARQNDFGLFALLFFLLYLLF